MQRGHSASDVTLDCGRWPSFIPTRTHWPSTPFTSSQQRTTLSVEKSAMAPPRIELPQLYIASLPGTSTLCCMAVFQSVRLSSTANT